MHCASQMHIFQIPANEETGWAGEIEVDDQVVPSNQNKSVT